MGCHTWSYRALNDSEFEETKNELISKKLGRGSFARQSYPKLSEQEIVEKIYKDFKRGYGEGIEKSDVLVWVRNDTECVDKLKNCTTMSELVRIYDNYFEDVDYKVIGDKIYVQCGFDIPVRIYGYPEESFTDPEEFIKWIKESEEKQGETISEYYIYDIDGTKNRVEGYTPDMETVIKNFWQKYNNHVYVRFG